MADLEFSTLSKQAARFAIGVQQYSMALLFVLPTHCLPPSPPPWMAWPKCSGSVGCFKRNHRLNTNTITPRMSKPVKFVALAKWYSKPNAFRINTNNLTIKLKSDDIIFSRPCQRNDTTFKEEEEEGRNKQKPLENEWNWHRKLFVLFILFIYWEILISFLDSRLNIFALANKHICVSLTRPTNAHAPHQNVAEREARTVKIAVLPLLTSPRIDSSA